MRRILVIGGYGGFGARLSRRLAGAGHHILVGGRSGEKAAAFAALLPSADPVVVDRDAPLALILAAAWPELVIDAAGPFQGSSYAVPAACIAAEIPYLDLADARAFVTGFGALDGAARAGGVAMVSGASSVPALSGAAARTLAAGLERVTQVDAAISAGGASTAGRSVAAAILSYAGRPVRLWRGQRWTVRPGCGELRRETFSLPGVAPVRRRLTALCDVPDHDLVPTQLPGRPAMTFRAGPGRSLPLWALWLASRPVQWGWLRSLSGLAGPAARLQRLFGGGSGRSAMQVTVTGWRDDTPVTRRWTLIAEDGEGAEVPTLAAALLAEAILAGQVAPGAQNAGGLLRLSDFESPFAGLKVHYGIEELPAGPPLYARVMGADWPRLPPLVRAVHRVHGDGGAAGEGVVARGRGRLARLAGRIAGFPPPGAYPLHVAFAERDGREHWTRMFGRHSFTSEMQARRGRLVERFGPLRFAFDLPADAGGLRMELRGWSLFGVPMPRILAPRIAAREWQEEDRFRFEVAVAMPLLGDVVRYGGWLRPLPISAERGQGGEQFVHLLGGIVVAQADAHEPA